jgi:hypothetical protein
MQSARTAPGVEPEDAGRSVFRVDRYGHGKGGLIRRTRDAVSLWTLGRVQPRLSAKTQCPAGKAAETKGVCPLLPTGPRPHASFTAPRPREGWILKSEDRIQQRPGSRPELILPGTCPTWRNHRIQNPWPRPGTTPLQSPTSRAWRERRKGKKGAATTPKRGNNPILTAADRGQKSPEERALQHIVPWDSANGEALRARFGTPCHRCTCRRSWSCRRGCHWTPSPGPLRERRHRHWLR